MCTHRHMHVRTHLSTYVHKRWPLLWPKLRTYADTHYTKSSSNLLLIQTRPLASCCSMYICMCVLSISGLQCCDYTWTSIYFEVCTVWCDGNLHYVNVGMVIYTTYTYVLYVDEPAISTHESVKCTHSKTYEILVVCTRLQQASKTSARPKACLCVLLL